MKLRNGMAAAAVLAGLAGCGSTEVTSFMVDGRDVALTLERVKPYAWSEGWELGLIVRRAPECQRRHPLKPSPADQMKVELYAPEPGVFIVKEGKRWYVTALKNCELQQFRDPPPQPGILMGAFQEKDGRFVFVPQPKAALPAAPSPVPGG